MRYAHYLKDTHSEQLIAMYTSSLNDYAERKMGRDVYKRQDINKVSKNRYYVIKQSSYHIFVIVYGTVSGDKSFGKWFCR